MKSLGKQLEKYEGSGKEITELTDKCYKDVVSKIKIIDDKYDFEGHEVVDIIIFVFSGMEFLALRNYVQHAKKSIRKLTDDESIAKHAINEVADELTKRFDDKKVMLMELLYG